MQTKIRFGIGDFYYVGIHYFRSKSAGGCKPVLIFHPLLALKIISSAHYTGSIRIVWTRVYTVYEGF